MMHRQRRRLAQLHTHLQGVAAAEEPEVYDGGFIITSTLDEQPVPPVQADGSLTAEQIAKFDKGRFCATRSASSIALS